MFAKELKTLRCRENLKFLENVERICPDKYDHFKQQFLEEEQAKSKFAKDSYAWIGINPPPDTSSLLDLYHKLLECNIYGGKAVVEQHTEGGVRPHIHQLAKVAPNVRKNHMITRLAKKYGLNENSINITISKNKVLIDKWTDYINGQKKDEKLENVDKDRQDRLELNIPDLIEL